jgi:mono/diheme cytochrome c family protein
MSATLRFTVPIACLLLVVLFAPQGCTYDNETDLYGPEPVGCDTLARTYTAHIKSIIDKNCVGCHQPGGIQSSDLLNSYNAVRVFARNGQLVSRTNNATNPMPPSGLMPECDRRQIEAWVKRGSPQ